MDTTVREDFERIGRLLQGPAPVESVVARWIDALPEGVSALEVGCGAGGVTARLAQRARRVLALDLAAAMVEHARRATAGQPHVEVVLADFMTWEAGAERFDAVVSLATLHHLPFEAALLRMAALLRPGGRLLVHDLFDARGLAELPYNALSFLRSNTWRTHSHAALTQAWTMHARHDHHMPIHEIRRRALAVLPGARVQRQLGWRYTLELQR